MFDFPLIRPALLREYPALADLTGRDPATLGDILVAYERQMLLACAGWKIEGDEARITACHATPAGEGRGLATILLHEVAARAAGQARLRVRPGRAAGFFERNGFAPTTGDEYCGPGPDRPARHYFAIRPALDDDADGLIALIGGCYGEYDGAVVETDGEDADLPHIASHFSALDGKFWVLRDGARILGSVGGIPDRREWVLKRLYLDSGLRGSGIADDLLELTLDEARRRGIPYVGLWSDTRFARAHQFYDRRGFVRTGELRALHDASNSVEYRFVRALGD